MAKYEVLTDFTDLQDNNKVYRKGGAFPVPANKKIDGKRIKELSSTNNKLGKKIIKETKDAEGQE